jgi:hypothetical protein
LSTSGCCRGTTPEILKLIADIATDCCKTKSFDGGDVVVTLIHDVVLDYFKMCKVVLQIFTLKERINRW